MKRPYRVLHSLVVLLATGLLGAFGYFVVCSLLIRRSPMITDYAPWCWSALISFMVIFAVVGIWKQFSWKLLVPLVVVQCVLITYLAWDDRESPPRPSYGPTVAEDDPAYVAYCWYVKGDARCRLAEIPSELAQLPAEPPDIVEQAEFVKQHREAYELAWKKDEIGRAWATQMAASTASGLFPGMKDSKSGMLSFLPIRDSLRACWGKALLLSVDGKPNEAVRILLPRLRAGYHLQKRGALLVTEMIAVVSLRGTYQRLEYVVEKGELSDDVRKELISSLQEATPIEEAIEKAFLGEQLFAWLAFNEGNSIEQLFMENANRPDHPSIPNIHWIREILYRCHKTTRETIEFYRWVGETGRQSRGKSEEKLMTEFTQFLGPYPLANPYGHYEKLVTLDSFSKITVNFWTLEDHRAALIAMLKNQ